MYKLPSRLTSFKNMLTTVYGCYLKTFELLVISYQAGFSVNEFISTVKEPSQRMEDTKLKHFIASLWS